MTISEATTLLRSILGETTASFWTSDQIKSFLSGAETRAASVLIGKSFNIPGWKEKHGDLIEALIAQSIKDTIITTPQEYTLPTDFNRHIHTRYKGVSTLSDLRESDLLSYEECRRRNQISILAPSYNFPIHYIKGGKIGFFPGAAGVFVGGIEINYYKNPPTIASQTDFSLHADVHIPIVHYAAGFAFEKKRKTQESTKYFTLAEGELNEL